MDFLTKVSKAQEALVRAAQAVVDDAHYSEEQECCLVDLGPLESLENALSELRKLGIPRSGN